MYRKLLQGIFSGIVHSRQLLREASAFTLALTSKQGFTVRIHGCSEESWAMLYTGDPVMYTIL